MKRLRFLPLSAVFLSIFSATASLADGDVFQLSNGTLLRGDLLNREQEPRTTYVVKTDDGLQLTLKEEQVRRFVPRSEAEVAYDQYLLKMPRTAEGHWTMAQWCREKNLDEIRQHHLREVVRLDPGHKNARLALGYTSVDGRWVNTDEWNRKHGYVYFQGSWRTPHEVAALTHAQKIEDEEISWRKKVKGWRNNLARQRSVAETLASIRAVRSPYATKALVETFDDEESAELRRLWIEIIGQIPSGLTSDTLVKAATEDTDAQVRDLARDILEERKDGRSIGGLLAALNSKDNTVVNRAGAALGRIADPNTILPLIDALNTKHKFIVTKGRPGNLGGSFSPQGGTNFQAGSSTKMVEQELKNASVYQALLETTKQHRVNFQYSETAWKEWYASLNQPQAFNLRRDD